MKVKVTREVVGVGVDTERRDRPGVLGLPL